MNTGIRRFILRLAVGLLAFLLGVTAAWALGRFNPFQNSSGTWRYQHKPCYRNWDATTSDVDVIYPVYRSRESSCRARMRVELGQTPLAPPAPPASTSLPPSPPPPPMASR